MNNPVSLEIRISPFSRDEYSKYRLMYDEDVTLLYNKLRNAPDEQGLFPVLSNTYVRRSSDDKNIVRLGFDLVFSANDEETASRTSQKNFLSSVSRAGLRCAGLDKEPLEDLDSFANWLKRIGFYKRDAFRAFASPWFRWVMLALLVLLLAWLLYWLFSWFCTPTSGPDSKPPVEKTEAAIPLDDSIRIVSKDDSVSAQTNVPVEIDVLGNDSIGDSGSVELSANTDSVQKGTIKVVGKKLQYTSAPGFMGEDSFSYTVKGKDLSGGSENSDSAVVHLYVSDDGKTEPPEFIAAVNDDITVRQGMEKEIFPLHNDHYNIQDVVNLIIKSFPNYGSAEVLEGNTIRYQPYNEFVGEAEIEYEISQNGESSTGKIFINVVESNVSLYAEGELVQTNVNTPVAIDVLKNDINKDGPVVICDIKSPLHGKADIQDNKILYTPSQGFIGTDWFSYSISEDKDDTCATAVVTVLVKPEESDSAQAVAVNDNAYTHIDTPVTINVLENDDFSSADATDNPEARKIITAYKPGHGDISYNDNVIRYSPKKGFTGKDYFTYEIHDKAFGKATVTVDVLPSQEGANVNSIVLPPKNYTLYVKPDESAKLKLEPESGNWRVSTHPSHGATIIDNNQSYLTYTPQNGYQGTDEVLIENGQDNSYHTVNVIIKDTDFQPYQDSYSTPKNRSTNLNVLSNDKPDNTDRRIESISRPVNGKVELSEDKQIIRYVPNYNFVGRDVFYYTANDDPKTKTKVSVFVFERGTSPFKESSWRTNAPYAYDDRFYVEVNSENNKLEVLDNDLPEASVLEITEIENPPLNGNAWRERNKCIVYTPKPGFTGRDSIKYRIKTADGKTDTAIIELFVGAEPSGKNIARNDYCYVERNGDCQIHVLNNDTWIEKRLPQIVIKPKFGNVETLSNGNLSYQPYHNTVGRDYFSYKISDDDYGLATVRVDIGSGSDSGAVWIDSSWTRPKTVTDNDHTVTDNDHTVTDNDYTVTVNDHTAPDNDYTVTDNGHTVTDNGHTVTDNGHTVTDNDHTVTVNDHTAPDNDHTVTDNDHTVTDNDHTVTDIDHTVTDNDHTVTDIDHTVTDIDETKDPFGSIDETKESYVILILNDTKVVKNNMEHLDSELRKWVKNKDKAQVAWIVIQSDGKSNPTDFRLFDSSNVDTIKTDIDRDLAGMNRFSPDTIWPAYQSALETAAQLKQNAEGNAVKTFFISDGDSATDYNEAQINEGYVVKPEVQQLKTKFINLSSRKK